MPEFKLGGAEEHLLQKYGERLAGKRSIWHLGLVYFLATPIIRTAWNVGMPESISKPVRSSWLRLFPTAAASPRLYATAGELHCARLMVFSTISLMLRTMPTFAGIVIGAAIGHAAAIAPVFRQQCDLAERELDACGISGQKIKKALRSLRAERAAMSSQEIRKLRKSGASVFEALAPLRAAPPWQTYRRREDREPVWISKH